LTDEEGLQTIYEVNFEFTAKFEDTSELQVFQTQNDEDNNSGNDVGFS
jgi:hypothetical protein